MVTELRTRVCLRLLEDLDDQQEVSISDLIVFLQYLESSGLNKHVSLSKLSSKSQRSLESAAE